MVQLNHGNPNLNLNRPATVESFQILSHCEPGRIIVQPGKGEEVIGAIVLVLLLLLLQLLSVVVHGVNSLRGIVTS